MIQTFIKLHKRCLFEINAHKRCLFEINAAPSKNYKNKTYYDFHKMKPYEEAFQH